MQVETGVERCRGYEGLRLEYYTEQRLLYASPEACPGVRQTGSVFLNLHITATANQWWLSETLTKQDLYLRITRHDQATQSSYLLSHFSNSGH